MAREVPDRSVCVQGLGTPLASAALAVAVEAHDRSVWTVSTEGGWVTTKAPAVALWPPATAPPMRLVRFAELILEVVPRYQPFEFMRPAQLDQSGISNNVVIVRPDGSMMWLPGCGGIADATSVNGNLVYYLPRHERRTLVGAVDFRSGGGRAGAEGKLPRTPRCVVTDLCVLRFEPVGPTVESVHDGATADDVRAATSFELIGLDRAPTTSPPTDAERNALQRVDPQCLRDLEFTTGSERRVLLRSTTTGKGRSNG